MNSKPSRSLADERGSMLIEVLVSAVLVAVIGVALFGALNSAAQVSGKSKTRAGAAAVAQDDQERMRAMPVATLNNFRDHRDPVIMGKTAYVVDSRAEWIADAKGATDCTANGAAADYLKITSTVSAKNIPLKPIVVTSTVTPAPGTFTSDEGSLAVSVTGADGLGRAGVNVAITGPGNDVQLTDANGCAFFGYEPVGGYNVTATASNFVDPNGNSQATGATSIGSQTVATLPLSYDDAGAVTVNFKTTPDNASTAPVDTKQGSVGLPNSGITINSGVRYFGNGTPVKSVTTPRALYPFPAAYSVFAGDCADNAAPTGATPDSIIVLPGRTDLVKDVTVPALNVVSKVERHPHPGHDGDDQEHDGGVHAKDLPAAADDELCGSPGRPGLPLRDLHRVRRQPRPAGGRPQDGQRQRHAQPAQGDAPVFNVQLTAVTGPPAIPVSQSGQCT